MTAPAADLGALAARIGHDFRDPALLQQAVSHRSWCAEHPGHESNERLEFLGDAVLGWLVADEAYHRYGDLDEGSLTGIRKGVVNAMALADAARRLDIGPHLRLGRGEAAGGGADKASILSDAFEAVIAALYLDGGPELTRRFVRRSLGPAMAETVGRLDRLDHKSRLQELAARAGVGAPRYTTAGEGPDHARTFSAVVTIDGVELGRGEGRSKKQAEQVAAAAAADEWQRRHVGAG